MVEPSPFEVAVEICLNLHITAAIMNLILSYTTGTGGAFFIFENFISINFMSGFIQLSYISY